MMIKFMKCCAVMRSLTKHGNISKPCRRIVREVKLAASLLFCDLYIFDSKE